MKRTPKPPKPITAQFTLSLMSMPTSTVVPQEKQKELKLALIDLLIGAAYREEESHNHTTGGGNESVNEPQTN